MAEGSDGQDILTLEPLVEAIRRGVEGVGWELSGLQKTTSHRFEGRWEGESTRSAYLFFHRDDLPDRISIDVYLDETSRGLKGNLALVLDGPDLGELDSVSRVLSLLAGAAGRALPDRYRRPLTVRFRVRDAGDPAEDARTEYRFKVHVPGSAVDAGRDAVASLAGSVVAAFESLLQDPDVQSVTLDDEG